MKAKIKNKIEVAKGTTLFEYDLLGEDVQFKPGQYFYVTLEDGLEHHFTIVNSPNEKGIVSNATRMRDTTFKNTLRDLPTGAEVMVDRIGGRFVLPDNTTKPLVFIALGIGITPFVSMTRFIKEESLDHKITLIYSDSNKESMAFLEEMEQYAKANPNFKLIVTLTKDPNWTGEKRHVDGAFLKDYLENPMGHLYYISGPPKAVEGVSNSLEQAGIPKENIKIEDFYGY